VPEDCSASQDFRVVVAGHLCLDIFPALDHLGEGRFEEAFHLGGLITVGPASFCTGGAVSNTGLGLHRLGVPVRLVARIGADPFGDLVRERIEQYGEGLSGSLRVDASEATSYSVVISPPGVERFVFHCRGANNAFCAADVDYESLARADLFHFGYPPAMKRMYSNGGAELVEMFRRAKAAGATTSLDMCQLDPTTASGQADWRAILTAALPYVDIFLPTFEELYAALHPVEFDRRQRDAPGGNLLDGITPELLSSLGAELLAMGVRVVGIKLGGRGLYLRTASPERLARMGRAVPKDITAWASRELWAPCFVVRVVGTTGAGDAAIAGFLGALLRCCSPVEAITMASALGACSVEAVDTLSGMRAWDDTLARVQAGWARRPLALDAPGWRMDEANQVWVGPGDVLG
jgi:sugar/nucleoside kinase (ribokinase family)